MCIISESSVFAPQEALEVSSGSCLDATKKLMNIVTSSTHDGKKIGQSSLKAGSSIAMVDHRRVYVFFVSIA